MNFLIAIAHGYAIKLPLRYRIAIGVATAAGVTGACLLGFISTNSAELAGAFFAGVFGVSLQAHVTPDSNGGNNSSGVNTTTPSNNGQKQ